MRVLRNLRIRRFLFELASGLPNNFFMSISVCFRLLTPRRSCETYTYARRMLVNGVSVERIDLVPKPDLIMHQRGDRCPALWRVYVRAPYVVRNALACDIVLWASQPLGEEDYGEEGDGLGRSPSSLSIGSSGNRPRRLPISSPFR